MYGSHNTLTAYPVRRWYMHILQPFARCQRKDVEGQIACGARAFDLRVRFDGKGGLVACHGLSSTKPMFRPLWQGSKMQGVATASFSKTSWEAVR